MGNYHIPLERDPCHSSFSVALAAKIIVAKGLLATWRVF